MSEKEVDEFMKSLGAGKEEVKVEKPTEDTPATGIDPKWFTLIRPTTVDIILGHKGKGKSGLGYELIHEASIKYNLTPCIINLPEDKQALLPSNYQFGTLDDIESFPDSAILIDEGTTKLPAGSGLENMIKGYSSMSRQRNQIIIFIFHATSDVGSRIFRGVDTVMIKEPSKRQIQFGSKDKFCFSLLTEAKEKFQTIADMGKDVRQFTFVDSEEPEFHGLISNNLPAYWCDDLSCAWGRAGSSKEIDGPAQSEMTTSGLMDCTGKIPVTDRMLARAIVYKDEAGTKTMLDPSTNVYWEVRSE